jgi:LAO/AO transport system kinase
MSDSNKKYIGDIFEGKNKGSALNISNGVEQPPQVNPNLKKKKRFAADHLTPEDYLKGILSGDINILGRAITLVESRLSTHYALAQKIVDLCLPYSGKSVRIGITGVPGVGKSTFIESLGMQLIQNHGKKLAVLAVDPSSAKTGGSILGDKTRMEQLAGEKNAFIRPSPSAGSLGGVARKTHEIIVICEAAGFDTIFIETVGVGQSETTVHNMVDFFLLLMLAGAGDELQGIKRGIMEMADSIVITKADGDNKSNASRAQSQYKNALHLFPPTKSGWQPNVLTCSAYDNSGISDVWDNIDKYCKLTKENNYFSENRKMQAKFWMYETVNEKIKDNFYHDEKVKSVLSDIENKVLKGEVSGFVAAKKLLDTYFK